MVGAEMPMTSDQVIWSEQNRLHVAYEGCTVAANGLSMTVPIEANKTCAIKVGKYNSYLADNGLTTLKARVNAATGVPAGNPLVSTVAFDTYGVVNCCNSIS